MQNKMWQVAGVAVPFTTGCVGMATTKLQLGKTSQKVKSGIAKIIAENKSSTITQLYSMVCGTAKPTYYIHHAAHCGIVRHGTSEQKHF
jgi:hypothetical protein